MKRILLPPILSTMLFAQLCRDADGVDMWTLHSSGLPSTNWLYDIAYGNDEFVAVGGSHIPSFGGSFPGAGVITTSADGTNWIQKKIPSGTGTLLGVTRGPGRFVAVGRNAVLSSPDGATWTFSSPECYGTSAVTYGNNMFVVECGGRCYSSTNATTWTSRPLNLFEEFIKDIAFGNSHFVAVIGGQGSAISTSSDGTVWRGTNFSASGVVPASVTYGNGVFAAVGSAGTIFRSTDDGMTWTQSNAGTRSNLLGVAHGNGVFVAVGSDGTILSWSDGNNWTPHVSGSGTTNDLTAVAYGNGHFVAVGANGTILESDPIIHLGQFTALSSGAVQFTLTGPAKQNYQLQTSRNLTNWVPLTDLTLNEPNATIVIISPTNFSQSFYRALVP